MWLQHCALILWVILGTNVPLQSRYLYHLYKVAFGVASYTHHASAFIFGKILVVEFVAVTVALAYILLLIYIKCTRTLFKYTLILTQTHSTSHIGDVLLLFHDVYHVVSRLLVHLAAVGVGIAQHVAGKLDNHHLHTQTDTKGGDVMGAGIVSGNQLALNATLAEAGTNHDTVLVFQQVGHVVFRNLLGVDVVDVYLVVVIGASL